MSRFCANCGTPMADDAVFCGNCGAKVNTEQQPGDAAAQTPSPQQPASAQPVQSQPAYVPQPTYTSASPKKKSHMGLILGIAGGVVVVAAIVVVLLLTGVLGGSSNDISDIEGKWYSSAVMIDFDDDGTVRIVTDGDETEGEYTYDAKEKEGEIASENEDYDGMTFKLRSDYLKMDGEKYYRDEEEAGYVESAEGDNADGQTQEDAALAQQYVGLWQAMEATYQGETGDMSAMGVAFEFAADCSVTEYEGYEVSETGAWEIMKSGALQLTASDGDVVTMDNIVMEAGGVAFTADVTTDDGTGSIRFVLTDMDAFLASENDLQAKIQGLWWVCGTSEEPPADNVIIAQGKAFGIDGNSMYSYYNFIDDMTGITLNFVDEDTVQFDYEGIEYTFDANFETIDGIEYFVMAFSDVSYYLLPTTYDAFVSVVDTTAVPANPGADATYTSDADIRGLLVREWNQIYYLDASGEQDDDFYDYNIKFYADGSFEEVYDGEDYAGRWAVLNGVLVMNYTNDDVFIWPVFVEYKQDMQAYMLYMEVVGDNKQGIGEYNVLSDYQP